MLHIHIDFSENVTTKQIKIILLDVCKFVHITDSKTIPGISVADETHMC